MRLHRKHTSAKQKPENGVFFNANQAQFFRGVQAKANASKEEELEDKNTQKAQQQQVQRKPTEDEVD